MIKWIKVAGCPAKRLPNEGEPVAVWTGREQWLSRWNSVLADPSLKGHVTHFAPASELSLPTPLKVSRAGIDEDRANTAIRFLRKKGVLK